MKLYIQYFLCSHDYMTGVLESPYTKESSSYGQAAFGGGMKSMVQNRDLLLLALNGD